MAFEHASSAGSFEDRGFLDTSTVQRMIRTAYARNLPGLMASYPDMDPRILEWNALMSPIEREVWEQIRALRLPFLPQFPVEGMFLDFADPRMKVDIECDGSEWHGRGSGDAERDAYLESRGWKVIRIPGSNVTGSCSGWITWPEGMSRMCSRDFLAWHFKGITPRWEDDMD